jgi:hypothetical protein
VRSVSKKRPKPPMLDIPFATIFSVFAENFSVFC